MFFRGCLFYNESTRVIKSRVGARSYGFWTRWRGGHTYLVASTEVGMSLSVGNHFTPFWSRCGNMVVHRRPAQKDGRRVTVLARSLLWHIEQKLMTSDVTETNSPNSLNSNQHTSPHTPHRTVRVRPMATAYHDEAS